MLFNSPEFIFVFMPIVLSVYWLALGMNRARACILVLVLASLIFYAYWKPIYLVLFLLSVGGNYLFSKRIFDCVNTRTRKILLFGGVVFNLGLLGYFKYALFVIDNLALMSAQDWSIEPILLPLAISFFTFQQIAYLVDCHKGDVRPPAIGKYLLFISFFPQLIAGPIVHHYQMLPQLENLTRVRNRLCFILTGAAFFFAGLFKKVVLADGIGAYAEPVFNDAASGAIIGTLDAWIAAFSFGFQIYFDFSGYSDMAIGLALLFGIRLPVNFNSPYKSSSIIEFWRRWHMTPSQFLRDHLYIPLGGNRHGTERQLGNMMIVMLLGGLWHGAGWGFVLWGGLHGVYLIINHIWRRLFPNLRLPAHFGTSLTFIAVMVAWVPFRAGTWDVTMTMWRAMAGFTDGALMTANPFIACAALAVLSGFTLFLPNTQKWLSYDIASVGKRPWLEFRPTTYWAILNGATAIVALGFMLGRTEPQEFLYFQF